MSDAFKRQILKEVISISTIISVFYYRLSKNFTFQGESHNFWEFIYADTGELIVTAGPTEYLLKAGELAFHRPNVFHAVRANGTTPSNAIVVSFECKNKTMQYFENKILFLSDKEKQLLSTIVNEAGTTFIKLSEAPPIYGMTKIKNAPFGAEQMVKISIEQLLISIYRRGDSILKKQRATVSFQQHLSHRIVEDILCFLDAHIHDTITLHDVSDALGISISQLKKVFKTYTQHSIIEYFIYLKIEEAKRMINEDSLNFTQIADQLGYGSIYYFSRIFKQKTGMTPTEYALSVNKS